LNCGATTRMSDTVFTSVVAIGATIIGALLTAFLQPAWAAAISPKSNLLVTVSLYPLYLPQIFIKLISGYRFDNQSTSEMKPQIARSLDRFSYSTQCIDITITNTGRKKVDNISLSFDNNREFIADIFLNGKYQSTVEDNSLNVDTLLPHSKCRIYIWQNGLNDRIKVTASEYDNIRYKRALNYENVDYYFHIYKLYVSLALLLLVPFEIYFILNLISHKMP